MRLSLLSDSYLSDAIGDAAAIPVAAAAAPLHFAALCRGVAVVLALAIPIALTLSAGGSGDTSAARDLPAATSATPTTAITKNL
jgi:hypothetical protein